MSEKTYTETEARALVAAALQRAADACADYPRAVPDYDEWTRYDEQIQHSQSCILALIDTDHAAALEAVKAQARESRERGIEKHLAAIMSQLEANEGYFSGNDLVTLQILQSHIKDSVAAIRAGKVQP